MFEKKVIPTSRKTHLRGTKEDGVFNFSLLSFHRGFQPPSKSAYEPTMNVSRSDRLIGHLPIMQSTSALSSTTAGWINVAKSMKKINYVIS